MILQRAQLISLDGDTSYIGYADLGQSLHCQPVHSRIVKLESMPNPNITRDIDIERLDGTDTLSNLSTMESSRVSIVALSGYVCTFKYFTLMSFSELIDFISLCNCSVLGSKAQF